MEKDSNNLLNLSNLPSEIQQHIAAYLDAPALGFFAQSNKQILKNVLPLLRKFKASFPLWLTSSKGHTTYIYQANQLFVCGNNIYVQLELGNTQDCLTFTAVPWPAEQGKIQQIIAGECHTVVLTHDNRLWVCGRAHYYLSQLGLGDTENRSTFTIVPWSAERGRIEQVVAGAYHTIVLTDANRLWVCGNNDSGQLGLGDKEERSTFTAVPWPKERGKIQQVIVGVYHTVVLTQDNRLWVCGNNAQGQLGLGDQVNRSTFTPVPWPDEQGRIEQIIAGGIHTLVLTDTNQLWVCGYNEWGQLGLGDKELHATFTAVPWPKERGKIQQVVTGFEHTVVLSQVNKLWVCGNNRSGQLGLRGKKDRTIFTAVPWPGNRDKIQQVIAGWNHTVVLTENNRLWACGDNRYGQLGLGDNRHRFTFTSAKALPKAMQQVFMLNNHLNQLIKLGTVLMQTPGIQSSSLRTQHQPDEPDGQPPLKKMRL